MHSFKPPLVSVVMLSKSSVTVTLLSPKRSVVPVTGVRNGKLENRRLVPIDHDYRRRE